MLTRRDFLKVSAAGGVLMATGFTDAAGSTIMKALPDDKLILEKGRRIPVLKTVDIVVVGGSSRAVAAASAAASAGRKVMLIAQLPYLGDDICGSMLYELGKDEELQTALSDKLFVSRGEYPTPSHVKKTLQDALLDSGVDFLLSSYPTNVLKDARGRVAGVVIANRSGRQAICAKAVIDATHEASIARMSGAGITPFTPGLREFQMTVVGNSPKNAGCIRKAEKLPLPFVWKGVKYPVTRYTIGCRVKEYSYAELMYAEQLARNVTWNPDQIDSSDNLWYIPSQTVMCEGQYEGTRSLRLFPIAAMTPKGISGLYILGPCAGMNREDASRLMRPAQSLVLGEVIGSLLADIVGDIPALADVKVAVLPPDGDSSGLVGEVLKPLRPSDGQQWVESPTGSLPVLGRYDVVVLGGGTAGASAGISAARNGANTLMLEYLHGLGGISTMGLIGVYWDGFREGYTARLDADVRAMAPSDHPRQVKKDGCFVTDWKMECLRKQYLEAGGELWFGAIGCGALVSEGTVKGVVAATPFGRGVILSKVLIDSTGSADIAIAAGADYSYTGYETLAVQGAGAGRHDPLDYSANNDWLFIDDSDILDVTRVFVQQKEKYADHFDTVKIPQTRERRRVIGEHVISAYDVLNHRRYPDTISYHKSSFDTHGYIIDPYFILSPPMPRHTIYDADVPLRSLLPRGLEGILTTGLGASAHRDAMPVIRMQPCLQNQGYAVGYLSAMAVRESLPLRKVDIKKVQRHLVSMGNLPERVLTDKEFTRFPSRQMKAAADSVGDSYKGLEVLLTDIPTCKKLMHQKMKELLPGNGNSPEAVVYASILCILGDSTYSSVLTSHLSGTDHWDDGWHYTGMHQFGMCVSRLDALMIALGRSFAGDKENPGRDAALSAVLEKAQMLAPEDCFSHFRAVSLACDDIASPKAAPVLASLLKMPGMRYHSVDSLTQARSMTVPDNIDVTYRNKALKEIHLARALYRSGDSDGLGRSILQRYSRCCQGHYARYAAGVLAR